MFSNNSVGDIEALEHKLKQFEQQAQTNSTGYWQKLSEYCKNMSADQLEYVNNEENVINAKLEMMEAFNLFLFEKFKDEFVVSDVVKPLCDKYINAIVKAQNNYSNVLASAIKENETLKRKLAELERKQNEKSNTKRA